MSTTERHLAALAWAVESSGSVPLDPIDSSAVPGPSSTRLDAARARAGEDLADALRHRDALAASLDGLRQDRSDLLTVIAEAEQAVSTATERRHRLQAEADGALDRAEQLAARRADLTVQLEQEERREAATAALLAGLEVQLDRLSGGPTSSEDQRDAAVALGALGADAAELGLETAAGSLVSWSKELSSGTAALLPAAVTILGELSEAEAQWQRLGSGDPGSAPAVIEAGAQLHAAQEMLREIEAEARSGGLGSRTRADIDSIHRHRLAAEAKGKHADPGEVAAAIDAETSALRQVGFDSILDYRIAMSTHGTGTLVKAARQSAQDRVVHLESSLEEVRTNTATTQMQIGDRIEQLRRAAEELTGDPGELSIEQTLRACLDTPDPVRGAASEIESLHRTARELLQRDRDELDALKGELRTVERNRSHALAEAVSAVEDTEEAQRTVLRSRDRVVESDRSIDETTRLLADADRALAAASSVLDGLAQRRYLDEDVRSFSEALIAAVEQHVDQLDGDGDDETRSVVVDDPLGGFDDADAVAVLDELIERDWLVSVLFVTSRPKLLNRTRRRGGRVRCVDGRRRHPGPHRWRRRTRAATHS